MSRMLDKLIERPVLVLLLASALTLGSAFFFQYALGYQPCDLCWQQRYPYMAVILISAIYYFFPGASIAGRSMVKIVLLLSLGFLLIDAAIAAFHVGVEQKWWEGPTSCSSSGGSMTIEEIMAAPLINCAVPAWTLFGISMAGYNFFIASALALFAGRALKGQ